jgi:acyl carrier protein
MSENEMKLRSAFSQALQLQMSEIHDDIAYEKTKGWDSVAHMALIAAIDSSFDIMMETDDVIDLSSFAKAKEILSKYGVQV